MDLMTAHDALVIEIMWFRSNSEGREGMLHPQWAMTREI